MDPDNGFENAPNYEDVTDITVIDDHAYKVFGAGKGANYSGYPNAQVDEALTKARQTDDPNRRKAAYAEFQQALAAALAYTFFCDIDAIYVAADNIQGIIPDTVLGHHGVGTFWNICDWTIRSPFLCGVLPAPSYEGAIAVLGKECFALPSARYFWPLSQKYPKGQLKPAV